MPPILKFIFRRFFFVIISFLLITALIYAGIMLTPAEERAQLYMPKNLSPNLTEDQLQQIIEKLTELNIERYHLNATFPVQYIGWLNNILHGTWGYSPTLNEDVLTSLQRRTPATLELTLYSLFLFIPLGIVTGAIAAGNFHKPKDTLLQATAFLATAMPTFILALFLISIFYAGLKWFPPGRVSSSISQVVSSSAFRSYTGLITVDGLLNLRLDVALDGLRHLVLPVFTLSLFHWATLQRITRAAMLDEFNKEYLLAVKAKGITHQRAVWHHALRNVFSPVLTSSMLSAASLLTGVYVVEIIYNYPGISSIIVRGVGSIPDAPAAVGFAVYSILAVLFMMFVLDIIQAWLDPRYREGILEL
jgi:ABC-type dipeptide/oligopeptide/nickel transport system permease component